MTFWLITPQGRHSTRLTQADRRLFRQDALELVMYAVPSGEAIVVSRGPNSVVIDGGSESRYDRNDRWGAAFARTLAQGSVNAIIASHPHRDHTNFHHALATSHRDRMAAGASYVDNATPAADANWNRLRGWAPNLPFRRLPVRNTAGQDGVDRFPSFSPNADMYLLRGATEAVSAERQKYWSVFLLARYRNAWMLFTGDAYKDYENRLLPRLQSLTRRVHFLKVTHHGSSDGTSEQLVQALLPGIAIASTDSDRGHRLEPDVRQRLSGAAIYTTYATDRAQRRKDIIVRTDGRLRQEARLGTGVVFEVRMRNRVLSP